jgi:hypothetical protein
MASKGVMSHTLTLALTFFVSEEAMRARDMVS